VYILYTMCVCVCVGVKNVTGVRRNGEYYVYGWRLRRPRINHYFPFPTPTTGSTRYPTSEPRFIIIYIYIYTMVY